MPHPLPARNGIPFLTVDSPHHHSRFDDAHGAAAERVAGIWGTAVLQGLPVNPPAPKPPTSSWFGRLFGG